ncbi:MAG TPA: hypothetical protein VGC71_02275 [Gaiellales bacterium]
MAAGPPANGDHPQELRTTAPQPSCCVSVVGFAVNLIFIGMAP